MDVATARKVARNGAGDAIGAYNARIAWMVRAGAREYEAAYGLSVVEFPTSPTVLLRAAERRGEDLVDALMNELDITSGRARELARRVMVPGQMALA